MQGVSSIFDWIVLSSLMGSILVFLILAVKFAFKSTLNANWHYYIWVLLLLRLIIPFTLESPVSIYNFVKLNSLGSIFSSQASFTELKNLSTETGNSPSKFASNTIPLASSSSEIKSDFTAKPAPTNFEVINWKAALIILWLIGVALLVGYTIFINLKLWYHIRTELKTNSESVTYILETCKSELKITKNIPIVITSKAHTPALFGPIKPLLLIPDSFIKSLTNTELKYIILHELAHWKRKDIIINWITALLQIMHWFNPVIWYGFYRMHQDCELACDALVLSSLDPERHKEYGRTIIRVLEMMLTPQWIPGTTRMLSQKSDIKRRIYMIAKFKKESLFVSIIAISIFILVGVVGCTNVPNTNVFQSNSKTEKGTYNQMLAGTVNVEGPGVVVTLSDGKSPTKDDPTSFIVHDADLRNIVNELTFAGAEAISINGERLIATSSIRCAGTSVLINGNQYSSPFVIKAIGNSKMMINSLELQSGLAEYLRKFGIKITIKKSESLAIPKYKGEVNFKYTRPVEN
ncbi:MAG: M56 family metallopeptidase [Syntrophomonas sp.]